MSNGTEFSIQNADDLVPLYMFAAGRYMMVHNWRYVDVEDWLMIGWHLGFRSLTQAQMYGVYASSIRCNCHVCCDTGFVPVTHDTDSGNDGLTFPLTFTRCTSCVIPSRRQ